MKVPHMWIRFLGQKGRAVISGAAFLQLISVRYIYRICQLVCIVHVVVFLECSCDTVQFRLDVFGIYRMGGSCFREDVGHSFCIFGREYRIGRSSRTGNCCILKLLYDHGKRFVCIFCHGRIIISRIPGCRLCDCRRIGSGIFRVDKPLQELSCCVYILAVLADGCRPVTAGGYCLFVVVRYRILGNSPVNVCSCAQYSDIPVSSQYGCTRAV